MNDPLNPVEAGFFDAADRVEAVAIVGNHAYVVDARDGLYILDCTNAVPVMLQLMSLERCSKGVRAVWEVFDETGVPEYRLYQGRSGEDSGRLVDSVPASGLDRYEITDVAALPGMVCRYTLAVVEKTGAERILRSRDLEARTPAALSLEPNKPNPFNPQTSIVFTGSNGRVALSGGYFCRIVAGKRTITRKLLLIK